MKHLTSDLLTQLRASNRAAPEFGDVMEEIVSEARSANPHSVSINMHSKWYDMIVNRLTDIG